MMLILRCKEGEVLLVGEDIKVTVLATEGKYVRLAIQAPSDVPVLRGELKAAT